MIVGVCGYGFTGSGAVTDLCKEFSDIQVLDSVEFKLTYMQDGLEDLAYHLVDHPVRFYSSDTAIRRFITLTRYIEKIYGPLTDNRFSDFVDEFIENIVQVSWRGISSSHKIGVGRATSFIRYQIAENFRKLAYKYFRVWLSYPDNDMYLSINPDNFISASQNFLENIIKSMGFEGEKIVINQAFPADRPEFSFPYFHDPRAICVSRDPRDLYILAKAVVKQKARFIPTDSVKDFTTFYRISMENQSKEEKYRDAILRIRFEDLIYEYTRTVDKIKNFIDCKEHAAQRTLFKPEISVDNTNLVKRYPRYEEDIKYIEQNLPEWLYPFDSYNSHQHESYGRVF